MFDNADKVKKIEQVALKDLDIAAREILNFSVGEKIFIFDGEMGAGKTTLIKALCRCLHVENTVQSPTFSLVNEYQAITGDTIYHFDFYRIKHQEEAMDIGVDEYLYSGNYCFIEWPTKITELLPNKMLRVQIEVIKGDLRNIHLTKHE